MVNHSNELEQLRSDLEKLLEQDMNSEFKEYLGLSFRIYERLYREGKIEEVMKEVREYDRANNPTGIREH